MSGGGDPKNITSKDIDMVQTRIEQCLRSYMNRDEVIKTLFKDDNIQPRFTEIVWEKLVEQNKEFFRAYFLKLMLKEQILKFNRLLSEQVALMRQLEQSQILSFPASNGSQISSMYQNPRQHVADRAGASTNPDNIRISGPANMPNLFSSGSSFRPCMQPMGNNMSAQNRNIDVNPNMLLAQPSNVNGNLIRSAVNGNLMGYDNGTLIKMEPLYDNRSPYDFNAQQQQMCPPNLFEPCSAVGDASISSFSSVESNPQQQQQQQQHPNEALLDADTCWIPHNFQFTDLAASFPDSSDLLESYTRPPFLTNDANDLLDSNGGIERFNNSSGLRYDSFSGD